MKEFLEYVTTFDPEFPKRIRGASPEQIAELERIVGRELPRSYRNFLAVMGENTGGFHLIYDAITDIEYIMAYYREEIVTDNWPLPPDSILIGAEGACALSFALDCRAPGEPPVMFVDGDTYSHLFAGSLNKLLFNIAFNTYALNQFRWEVSYSASLDAVGGRDFTSILPNLARRCGLQPLWFSDRIACCAEKAGVGACLSQPERSGPSVRIAGNRWFEVAWIGWIIARRLGLGAGKWTKRKL